MSRHVYVIFKIIPIHKNSIYVVIFLWYWIKDVLFLALTKLLLTELRRHKLLIQTTTSFGEQTFFLQCTENTILHTWFLDLKRMHAWKICILALHGKCMLQFVRGKQHKAIFNNMTHRSIIFFLVLICISEFSSCIYSSACLFAPHSKFLNTLSILLISQKR